MALIGNPPGNNGSQFLVFLKDVTTTTPEYPIVGKVTGGPDTLAKISKIPTGTTAPAQGEAQGPKISDAEPDRGQPPGPRRRSPRRARRQHPVLTDRPHPA